MAKHGVKSAEAETAEKPKADPAAVSVKKANLPDAPTDIQAEMARILATDLDEVDQLLEREPSIGVTPAGVATVQDDAEESSDERGYMGLTLGGDPYAGGALIAAVNPGSPAASAGLMAGDLILSADGTALGSSQDLIAEIGDRKLGQTVSLEVERGDEELELDVILGPRSVLPQQVQAARVEDKAQVVLPSNSRDLLSEDVEVFDHNETDEETRLEDVTNLVDTSQLDRRPAAKPEAKSTASDALPEGYVEIVTTRERRPAASDDLRSRIDQLEREMADLKKEVAELRAELSRRNPR